MPLGNYVILKADTPERMHFTDHHIEIRPITDSLTRRTTPKNVALFDVDRLDGQPVNAQFSILAEGLYAKFETYLKDNLYRNYEFIVTQRGFGFQTRYTVEAIPLGK